MKWTVTLRDSADFHFSVERASTKISTESAEIYSVSSYNFINV